MEKGVVCVTGGTGYVASWLIMRLLQQGYAVNTTVRSHPDKKKDVSYLTNLPGASERLRIFNADLNIPESFNESIQGCIGVFHTAHNTDFEGKDGEETNTKRSIDATISILQACVDSKTVKRVVYTASSALPEALKETPLNNYFGFLFRSNIHSFSSKCNHINETSQQAS
ncbi:Epimerase domain-containing protein [Heracleum sosnowskyi]|uniref:Epimerase domain-containing protein n=1 Tax=Heracleum sosnowskyi TaxID=360622 RepID=A0AAD8MXT2_9APIA|nr:Epimerase domain-containing protein [Heracleum sosnowskyi]